MGGLKSQDLLPGIAIGALAAMLVIGGYAILQQHLHLQEGAHPAAEKKLKLLESHRKADAKMIRALCEKTGIDYKPYEASEID